jgi:cation diffusion facilitator family transporter
LFTVIVGLLALGLTVAGYIITNSAAVLSDAIGSAVQVVAATLTFYILSLAGRPAERQRPYDYVKAEFFAAGMEGGLILIAAIATISVASLSFLHGSSLRSPDAGIVMVGTAAIIRFLVGYYLIRTGSETGSPTIIADGNRVLGDVYISIGVLAGLILIRITGISLLDPVIAVGMAATIIIRGYLHLRDPVRGLMNVSDPDTVQRVVEVMNRIRTPDVIDIHRLNGWKVHGWNGDASHIIEFHITVPNNYRLMQIHEIEHQIGGALRLEFDGQTELFLHVDPCDTSCCPRCQEDRCEGRDLPGAYIPDFTVAEALSPCCQDEPQG